MIPGVARGGIPAAAGYPSYDFLTSCHMSDQLLSRFYCSTIYNEIMDMSALNEALNGAFAITFRKQPTAKVHKYYKDMVLKHDTFSTDVATLTLTEAVYYSLKVDEIDRTFIEDWDMWVDRYLEAVTRQVRLQIDAEILCSLYTKADCHNKGAQAGCSSGMYNLGTPGAPRSVNSANVGEIFQELSAVLDEACIPETDRWIILPPEFKRILANSAWGQCCLNELAQALYLNGRLPGSIAGFTIYVSNRLSRVFDPVVNKWVYNIIAGWNGSAAFAAALQRNRIAQPADSFDTMYQGLMVYGWDVLYPEGLLHLYTTFDF
jgi:hypothetical protein